MILDERPRNQPFINHVDTHHQGFQGEGTQERVSIFIVKSYVSYDLSPIYP